MGVIPQLSDTILQRKAARRKFIFKTLDIKRGNKGIEFPTEGGILTYFEGEKYPWRGFYHKEPVLRGPTDALDTIKAVIRAIIETVQQKPLRYLIPLICLLPFRKRLISNLLEGFTEISSITLRDYYLKPDLFCQAVREIHKAGIALIGKITGSTYEFLMMICMFLEFDDTYRLIFQDAFGEIDIGRLLKNPRKELNRIFGILIERETRQEQKDKWIKIKFLFNIGSWLFRKELRELAEVMAIVDFSKIRLDEIDNYHALTRVYYSFDGKSFEERFAMRKKIDTS